MKRILFSAAILFFQLVSHAQFWDYVGPTPLGSSANVVYADSATNALYVGGSFTTPTTRIAKWDGVALSNLGTGINGQVHSITRYNGALYAGGNYSVAGGVVASSIAKWNGSAWSTVGAGVESNTNVYALCVYNGELYAGGTFEVAGTTSVTAIAKWNGTAWSSVGTGMNVNATVNALVVHNNELYVGGNFTTAGGTAATNIAKWNGTTWSAVGTGMDFSVQALHVWNGDLYAGGSFLNAGGGSANRIAKWNGSAWSTLGTGFNGWIYSLGHYNGELYAGGNYTTAGGASIQGIARWDGVSWKNVNEGMSGETRSLAVYKGALYAAGSMGYVIPYFAKWDNTPPVTMRFQNVYRGKITTPNSESVYDVEQTYDWGYMIAGHTTSYGVGNGDGYLIKTDTAGTIQWAKLYGGTSASTWESIRSVVTASDGSMVTTGLKQTSGNNDVMGMGIDKDGASSWVRTYGTTANEQGWDVKKINSVAYIMSGTTSTGTNLIDPLLMKWNGAGNIIWAKKYVTTPPEEVNSLELTANGGFIMAGTSGTSANKDIHVLYTDSNGNVIWDRTFGGTGEEMGYIAKPTLDGGFLVGGHTSTYVTGTQLDALLIKLTSTGAIAWSKTYGTTAGDYERINAIEQKSDGSFLITGLYANVAASNFEMLAMHVNSDGSVVNAKAYGGEEMEGAVNMDKCADGGFVAVGQTNSFPFSSASDFNIYLVKADSLLNSGSCHQTDLVMQVGSPAVAMAVPGAAASNAGLTETAIFITEGTAPFTPYELSLAFTITKSNASCNGGNNGQASVVLDAGVPPFTYLWSNNGTSASISGLSAGDYTVTVTDSTLCAVTQTVSISQPTPYNVSGAATNVSCFGGSNGAINITVSGSTPPYTYSWSPGGATTQDISGLSINNYSVAISDANACTATYSASIGNAIASIPICVVTVDSVTYAKNMLVWEKPVTTAIDSFFIYRNVSTVMMKIGAQSYSVESTFVDSTAGVSPKTQAHEYAISILDSCGNESALSPTHITIHQLTPVFVPPSSYDLVWSPAQGFPFPDYEIWRDSTDKDKWQKIGLVPFTLSTTYTDPNAPTDSVRYRIQVVPPQPCDATIKNIDPMATTVKSSKSNSQDKLIGPTSVNHVISGKDIEISPNPSKGNFSIQIDGAYWQGHSTGTIKARLCNVLGETIYETILHERKTLVNIPELADGIYQLQVVSNSGVLCKRIVISR